MKKHRKLNVFKQNFKKTLSHTQFKRMIVTIGAALCIGFIFGFIILQMVSIEKNQAVTDINTANIKTEKDSEQTNLEAVSLYIQQAGVFSEKANATEYATSLENKQIPFIIREADEQYFIWMDPTLHEKEAKKSAKKLDEQGISTYVKTWEIPATTLTLEISEIEWLQTYQALLLSSLEESSIKQEAWTSLLEEKLNENYRDWQKSLEDIFNQESVSEKQLILEILAHYENIIKDVK